MSTWKSVDQSLIHEKGVAQIPWPVAELVGSLVDALPLINIFVSLVGHFVGSRKMLCDMVSDY